MLMKVLHCCKWRQHLLQTRKMRSFPFAFFSFPLLCTLGPPFSKVSSFPEEVQCGQCTYHRERRYATPQPHVLISIKKKNQTTLFIYFSFSICIKLTIFMFLEMKVTTNMWGTFALLSTVWYTWKMVMPTLQFLLSSVDLVALLINQASKIVLRENSDHLLMISVLGSRQSENPFPCALLIGKIQFYIVGFFPLFFSFHWMEAL